MEIDKYQKAINYFEQELVEIPNDIGFDKEVCDRCLSHVRLAIAALERQREIKRCMDNINKNPEPNEHIEGDTCKQYCGDCPHRICGRQKIGGHE